MTANEIVAEALARLDGAKGEVVLDFSSVARVDSRDVRALENLAQAAEAKSIKLSVCGVNVGVYKVLKLSQASGSVLLA